MKQRRWFERYRDLLRASMLQRCAALGLIVLALITLAESNLLVVLERQAEQMLSAVLPGTIVELTNGERTAHALTTLTRNPLLDEAARLKAMNMRNEGYFAHWSPEGTSPWFWFDQVGYDYLHAGENLAIYFTESTEVVKAWMESPLHRENILRPEYTEIGVAAVEGKYKGYNTVFVVQLFGTPAAKTVATAAPAAGSATSGATTTVLGATAPAPAPVAPVPVKKVALEEPIPVAVPVSSTTDAAAPVFVAPEATGTEVHVVPVEQGVAYVSDHAATTSIGKTAAPPSLSYQDPHNITGPRIPAQEARKLLQTLYVMLALLVGGLIVASIIYAERHLHHTQAAFGTSLLGIMLALVSAHVYFVHIANAAL